MHCTYVARLKKIAAATPYLFLVHSVKTKPSGHCFLMVGPKMPNINIGKDDENAYIIKPWTPVMVDISG